MAGAGVEPPGADAPWPAVAAGAAAAGAVVGLVASMGLAAAAGAVVAAGAAGAVVGFASAGLAGADVAAGAAACGWPQAARIVRPASGSAPRRNARRPCLASAERDAARKRSRSSIG